MYTFFAGKERAINNVFRRLHIPTPVSGLMIWLYIVTYHLG
jgi:hypothetical protein